MLLHPPPTPDGWIEIEDPVERLRIALASLYAYYGETEQLTANLLRDAAISTAVAEAIGMMSAALKAVVELLATGWSTAPDRASTVQAALEHAISFDTWRSLCRRSALDERTAIELMVGLVRSAASLAPET